MINTDAIYTNIPEEINVAVITKDLQLEFIEVLSTYNFKFHVFDIFPNNDVFWEAIPDTIIIDNRGYPDWEKQLALLQENEAYKEIPIIVLNQNKIKLEEMLLSRDKNYVLVYYKDSDAILQLLMSTVKYWKKLNKALIENNQLNRVLSTNYLVLDAKNECLESSQKQIKQISELATLEVQKQLTKLNDKIEHNLKKGYHYQLFQAHFEEVHPMFFKRLLATNKKLTHNDLKLASFLKMNFNNSEISFFMGISMAGVKKAIQRLRIKLKLSPKTSLRQYLFTIES